MVQLYWIDSAIDLKTKEFDRLVAESLTEVVDHLEKQETLNKIRSHQQGKFLFFDADSISTSIELPDTGYDVMMVREIKRENEQIEVNVVEERDGQKTSKRIVKEIDGTNDTLLDIIENQLVFEIGDTNKFEAVARVERVADRMDSILRKRVHHKTAVVGDIVKSLIEVDIFETIEDRVDSTQLHQLLSEKLAERNIAGRFEFGVVNSKGELVLGNTAKSNELLESGYKKKLFPNDVIGHSNFLRVNFPSKGALVFRQLWMVLFISTVVVILVIAGFAYAALAIFRQKQLSEIKNDFVNNMTHELKTPISTISLACQALSDKEISQNQNMSSRYITMIDQENKRLGMLVENVLQSSLFDKGEFDLKIESVCIQDVVDEVISKIRIQVEEKGGEIVTDYPKERLMLDGDKIHLTNVVSNLLDNANKYCNEIPKIVISVHTTQESAVLKVKDNGIGISKENQKKIFEKLYRVPTGNLHNAKGFGLGLNYVDSVVSKHGGSVTVESELGEGSTFIVKLPKQQHEEKS